MEKAFEAFKSDPKNERLRKKVEHLPEAEQMLFVTGHEIGAYFEDMVVKNHDLHTKLTNQWRKNSDNEICLELTGLLHSMGVEGYTRASDKKNHTYIGDEKYVSRSDRLKKIRQKGANSKALRDYVKEAVTFQRAYFKYAGIKELTVYRGVKRQADKFAKDDEVTLKCREASSFTLDPGVAKAFGRVLAYKVPVEAVLMSPLTSPHFASSLGDDYVAKDKYRGESELVLMGGSTLKGKVVS
jgi:cobalamin-dependent methionine synthase I